MKIGHMIRTVAAAAVLAAMPLAAVAQEVKLRLAHVFPEHSSVGEAANMLAKLAGERSGGRIAVTVFPSGQLGGDEAIGRELARGTIQLALINPNSMVGIDPLFDFHILPYIAGSYEEADRIYFGDENVLHRTLNETLERHGMKRLGYFENDFRAISNSRHAVKSVADLKGLKLRVVPSQSLKLLFEKAGVQVVTLPFPEIFTALQQGAVDGQENGVILVDQARFYEAQKYVTLSNHSYVMSTIAASQRALSKLSEEDRKLLAEVGDEVGKWQVRRNRENVATALANIRAAGLEVVELSPESLAEFRQLADQVWADLTPVYGKERVAELRALIDAK